MTTKDTPVIAAKVPAKVALEAVKSTSGAVVGRSNAQPFCDGSHRGTSITPLKFSADKTGDVVLCQCKSTGNAPFCDGTHATLGELLKAMQHLLL